MIYLFLPMKPSRRTHNLYNFLGFVIASTYGARPIVQILNLQGHNLPLRLRTPARPFGWLIVAFTQVGYDPNWVHILVSEHGSIDRLQKYFNNQIVKKSCHYVCISVRSLNKFSLLKWCCVGNVFLCSFHQWEAQIALQSV